ncbi:MAG: glycine betaine/L-proline ABC transporter ATP-binding protein [Candidatus Adiutricales bacterium]
MSENGSKIWCRNLWKVFGPRPDAIIDTASEDSTKEQILEETGHVIAVRDVSFEVKENEIFVVMGLSGSGKSTLIRCINRLIEPTRGAVCIEGADIARMNDTELRNLRRHKLSMVFQNFGLLPHRTVLDNVAFGLEVRGEGRKERHEKALQMLEQVGLKGWEKNRIHELSGGMQQRVGLARALASGAETLLMDEAFSALDPLIRRQMQDEFLNLHTTVKRTVIFITHDLGEALKLGDRIAIMRGGEIVQIGSPEEIVTRPADDYVSEFVRDVPKGKVLYAQSIMEEPSTVIQSDQSIDDAIEAMRLKEGDWTFIIDGTGRIKGTLTLEDARAAVGKGLSKAGEAARSEFASTSPDVTLERCLSLVTEESNIPVAVLDDERHLLGVITRPALFEAIQPDDTDGKQN